MATLMRVGSAKESESFLLTSRLHFLSVPYFSLDNDDTGELLWDSSLAKCADVSGTDS
jgi:hypothetical protein